MRQVTWDELKEAARAVVKIAGPGYVYGYDTDIGGEQECVYAPDDINPQGCLIGAIVRRLGVEGFYAKEMDSNNRPSEWDLGPFDKSQLRALANAQYIQDFQHSWDDALLPILMHDDSQWVGRAHAAPDTVRDKLHELKRQWRNETQ